MIHLSSLTDDIQINDGLSLSVFVLDDNLVSSLVLLGGTLQTVLGLVGGGVDVLYRQAGSLKEPVGIGAGVGIVRDHHDEGLASICHQILIRGLDLRNSY